MRLVIGPIQVRRIPHRRLLVVVRRIRPNHEARIHQRRLLRNVAPVLQNHVNPRIVRPNMVAIIVQNCDPGSVVRPVSIGGLRKALREIPAEPIDVVLVNPVRQRALDKIPRDAALVVPVVEPVQSVRGIHIEPRVVVGWLERFLIPVHHEERIGLVGVVPDNIKNHSDFAFVAFVDELLQFRFCAVCLVGRPVEGGVVAPAVVAIEFVDRHQLQGIDSQSLEVVQGVENGLVIPLFGEVSHQQFIDDQVFVFRALEGLICPAKFRSPRRQNPHRRIGGQHVGKFWHVGERRLRNPLVPIRIEHQFRVGIGDPDVVGHDVVVEAVQFPRRQSLEVDPETLLVWRLGHHEIEIQRPIVEISSHKNEFLARGKDL